MRKNIVKWPLIWGIVFILTYGSPVLSIESEKHVVILDSVEVSAGKSFVVGVSVIADKIDPGEDPGKMGFGSFCIPLKYDREAFVVDSVIFMNTLTEWDEKFTNPRIDTGFVSLSGIYDMGGKDNPPVYTPKKPEKIAEIFFTAGKKAENGIYEIQLTKDPRQSNIYLGSPKGIVAVTPKFVKGIILVK